MKCPLIPCTHVLSANLNEKTSEDATMCTFWFAAKSQPQFVQKRNLDLNSASRRGMGEVLLTPILHSNIWKPHLLPGKCFYSFSVINGPNPCVIGLRTA